MSENKITPRIIGTGYFLPKKLRFNDDPIFQSVQKNSDCEGYFTGYHTRHILDKGERLIDMMLPAALIALKNSGKKASDIDMILGCGTIGQYQCPNELAELHKMLGLPQHAWVLPVVNDYSNFASSLLFADGLIKAGRAKNILICIGTNWTRMVDYNTCQCISVGDGAGAAVIGISNDKTKWEVADQVTVTDTSNYGTMYMSQLPIDVVPPFTQPDGTKYNTLYSPSYFIITPEGLEGFKEFGGVVSITAVQQLLEKNKLTCNDINFMPHQTSVKLVDAWIKTLEIDESLVLNTIKEFANLTSATHIINLAHFEKIKAIKKDKLVMFALGPEMHSNAMLLKRG